MSSLSQDHDLAADAATVSERSAPSPAGHTPGPWVYRPMRHDDWGTVRGPDGWVVARASTSGFELDQLARCRRAGTDPVEANARLIAAAPELQKATADALEFAVKVLAFLGRDRGTDRIERTIDNLRAAAMVLDTTTRAAIAKAAASPSDAQSVRPDGGE